MDAVVYVPNGYATTLKYGDISLNISQIPFVDDVTDETLMMAQQGYVAFYQASKRDSAYKYYTVKVAVNPSDYDDIYALSLLGSDGKNVALYKCTNGADSISSAELYTIESNVYNVSALNYLNTLKSSSDATTATLATSMIAYHEAAKAYFRAHPNS